MLFVLALTLGKAVFHLVSLDLSGKVVVRKSFAVHFVVRPTRYAIETFNTLELAGFCHVRLSGKLPPGVIIRFRSCSMKAVSC